MSAATEKAKALRARAFCLRVFGKLGQLGERGRILNGHVGKHLTVDPDTRFIQAGDQGAVVHAVQAGRRIDTGDPKNS